jgi:DNA repair exonuclease SbcCD ATPase subunit
MAQLEGKKLQLVQEPIAFCKGQHSQNYKAIYFVNSEYSPQWNPSPHDKRFDPEESGEPPTSVCTEYLKFLDGNNLGQYSNKFNHINIYRDSDATLYFFKAPDEISRLKNATKELKTSNERLIDVAQGIKRQNVKLSQDVARLTRASSEAARLQPLESDQLREENERLNSKIRGLQKQLEIKDEQLERSRQEVTQTLSDHEERVKRDRAEHEQILEQIQNLNDKLTTRESEVEAQEKQVESILQRESESEGLVEELESTRQELDEEWEKMSQKKAYLDKREETLNTYVTDKVTEAIEKLRTKDAHLIASQTNVLASNTEEIEKLRNKLKELQTQNTKLLQDNNKLTKDNEWITADALQVRTKAKQLGVKIRDIRSQELEEISNSKTFGLNTNFH